MNISLRLRVENFKFNIEWTLKRLVQRFKAWKSARAKGFKLPKARHMEPIPAGDNPFRHDATSMGSDLVRGWVVMHEGFDRADSPRNLNFVILVNTRTGQRIFIDLRPIHIETSQST